MSNQLLCITYLNVDFDPKLGPKMVMKISKQLLVSSFRK